MATTSSRALGAMLSGAALAGWLAGSTLSPPVAITQVAPPRSVAPPIASAELPHVAWPVAPRRAAPAAPSRNPFAFRSAEPVAASRRGADVAADVVRAASLTAADTVAAAPEPHWRLSGIASSENGDVIAVISGGGDVHLVRAGDELPGGDGVVEVGQGHAVVRTAAGPLTLRLP